MNPQCLASSLGALRNAGSVFGLLFSQGQEIIFHDAPFPDHRVKELTSTLDDIAYYFEQERRSPDQLAFGYDGGSLLLLFSGNLHLVVFHHQIDEIDFIAKAARAFLKDYETGVMIEQWRSSSVRPPELSPATAPASRTVAPTAPIVPMLR